MTGSGSSPTPPPPSPPPGSPGPRVVAVPVSAHGDGARRPPPRPVTTAELAPPGPPRRPPRPRTVGLAGLLWFAASAAGLAGLVLTALDGTALRERLSATARAEHPESAADVIDDGVRVTMLVVLGTMAVLVLLTLLATALLLRGRSWARWVLLVVGLLTLFTADVAQSLVAGGADADRIAFITQAALVVLAWVALLTRPVRAWLRAPRG